MFSSSRDRWVEPFQMTSLNDAAMFAAQLENPVGIGEIRSQRLLDQQIDPRRQQRLGSRGVMHRRHTHRRSIDPADRSQTGFNRLEARDLELLSGGGQRSRITIHNADKLNILARLLQFAIDPQMVAPKGARTDDDNPQWH
jgi:hypothetical protein